MDLNKISPDPDSDDNKSDIGEGKLVFQFLSNLILGLEVTPLYYPKPLDGVNSLLIEQTTNEMDTDDCDDKGNFDPRKKGYYEYNKEE